MDYHKIFLGLCVLNAGLNVVLTLLTMIEGGNPEMFILKMLGWMILFEVHKANMRLPIGE